MIVNSVNSNKLVNYINAITTSNKSTCRELQVEYTSAAIVTNCRGTTGFAFPQLNVYHLHSDSCYKSLTAQFESNGSLDKLGYCLNSISIPIYISLLQSLTTSPAIPPTLTLPPSPFRLLTIHLFHALPTLSSPTLPSFSHYLFNPLPPLPLSQTPFPFPSAYHRLPPQTLSTSPSLTDIPSPPLPHLIYSS
ncbi:hypothetical protein J6590_080506 [Homalodisca vitripennis]|nr:hypothetical protein J6590_080506 [Homalodisca vitripennis]